MIALEEEAARLVGPFCKRPLRLDGAALVCAGGECRYAGCPGRWPVEGGVAAFLPPEPGAGSLMAHAEGAPRVETDYMEKGKASSAMVQLYTEYGFRLRHAVLERHARALGRCLDVLDVGSGELLKGTGGRGGRHFGMLKELGRSYRGIDPSDAMIRAVHVPDGNIFHLPDALLVRGVGEALPFPPTSCDAALFLSMLDHTVDPVQVLREAAAVLRPGGLVLVTLHNRGSWQRRVLRRAIPRRMERVERANHHNYTWDPASLADTLREAGLEPVERHDYRYLWLPRLPWLEDLLVGFPARLAGVERGVRAVARVEPLLSRLLPARGAFFLMVARKPGAPREGAAGGPRLASPA